MTDRNGPFPWNRMADATPQPVDYARKIGLFSATMLVIGGIIGSGIFRNPAEVARVKTPTPGSLVVQCRGGDSEGRSSSPSWGSADQRSAGGTPTCARRSPPGWLARSSYDKIGATILASYLASLLGWQESTQPAPSRGDRVLTLVNIVGVLASGRFGPERLHHPKPERRRLVMQAFP